MVAVRLQRRACVDPKECFRITVLLRALAPAATGQRNVRRQGAAGNRRASQCGKGMRAIARTFPSTSALSAGQAGRGTPPTVHGVRRSTSCAPECCADYSVANSRDPRPRTRPSGANGTACRRLEGGGKMKSATRSECLRRRRSEPVSASGRHGLCQEVVRWHSVRATS